MELQEYAHKVKCRLPVYTFELLREDGEKFHKCTCYMSLDGTSVYYISRTKKEAKAKTAELMLLAMPHLDELKKNKGNYVFL